MPGALAGFPGANIGIDYKHLLFGSYNVLLGTIPTRQVNSLLEKRNERINVQIRVYDLDDLRAATIRSKIQSLPADAHFILLTLR